MPSYQYVCKSCNTSISVIRNISEDDPGYACHSCKMPMSRVYSIGAVTFNGSGFYSKDK